MIEIKELRALRGPNRHTRHTAIFMVLDIKEYESRPSDKIKGFSDRLLTLIPTFQNTAAPLENPEALSKGFKPEPGPAILLSILPLSFNAWPEWKLDTGKPWIHQKREFILWSSGIS